MSQGALLLLIGDHSHQDLGAGLLAEAEVARLLDASVHGSRR